MKGRRTWRGLTANCARIELPKVSAVMPVPSETKKTVRVWHGSAAGDRAIACRDHGSPARRIERSRRFHRTRRMHARRLRTPLARSQRVEAARGLDDSARRRAAGSGSTGFSPSRSFPMSSTHLATALVVPFEHLRMTDVEAVGGKNASLGEMISQLAASGVRVPGGFATTAHAFREFLRARRPGRAHRRSASPTLDTDDVRALAAAGAEIRGWIEDAPFPPALEEEIRAAYRALAATATDALVRGALVGHRRGPARRLVRRPAGDLPEHRRHRRRAARDAAGLRLALQRPRDHLPRAQGLRARRRRAVGRRAAHGAQRPRRRRRDVHASTPSRGFQRRRLHHLELRPGRDGGAGRGQPGRVLRPQADARRAASRRSSAATSAPS